MGRFYDNVRDGMIGLGMLAAGTVLFNYNYDFLGSWGTHDVERFKHQGIPAVVQRDDRILAPDKFKLILWDGGNDEKMSLAGALWGLDGDDGWKYTIEEGSTGYRAEVIR